MKTALNYILWPLFSLLVLSCSKGNDHPVANNVTLHFSNVFKNEPIVLGDAHSTTATKNTSSEGQIHHFSELKYVISNIRLVKTDGTEIPYHINDLDKGATVVNQAKPQTLDYVLNNIPSGAYKELKFGLGVKWDLNTLDEVRFPIFYAEAGAYDTEMHWQWSTGYRFTKIEGFYSADHKPLSIHTGSTLDGTKDDESTYVQGVDGYRDITLHLPEAAVVGDAAPKITIQADFDKLLSGTTKVVLNAENANGPGYHSGMGDMIIFVDNLGGNGSSEHSGMFSIKQIKN